MDLKPINVNGYDTFFIEATDNVGKHLLIGIPEGAGKDISNICGTLVNEHLIKMIDYSVSNGVRFTKAYY